MSNQEPVAVPVKGVPPLYGFTRSEVYRRLAAGDFKAVKNGKRTLVLTDSIRNYLASLPAATFRPPAKQARRITTGGIFRQSSKRKDVTCRLTFTNQDTA